jgi:hypothetical protein
MTPLLGHRLMDILMDYTYGERGIIYQAVRLVGANNQCSRDQRLNVPSEAQGGANRPALVPRGWLWPVLLV